MKYLIAPFQWLVDWSQKRPIWWGRQVNMMTIIAVVLVSLFDESSRTPFYIGIRAFIIIGQFRNSRKESFFYRKGSFNRAIFFLLVGLTILSLFVVLVKPTSEYLAYCLLGFSYMAFEGFGWCKPPAPPKRRTSSRKVLA